MNPLQLNKLNRKYYEALVDLHFTDIFDEEKWLAQYRKVKTIKKIEGKKVFSGWKCFFLQYNNWCDVKFAEKIYGSEV